jgi:3-oxoacyl-[acyl-carrier-protein] synthase II
MEPKEQRKVDEFILYGMAAAEQAVKDRAGRPRIARAKSARACLIGSGIGGLSSIADTSITLKERARGGCRRSLCRAR